MKQYVHAGGVQVQWLVNRRSEEAWLLGHTPTQWANQNSVGYTQNNMPQYISYYENNGKLPTGMKDNTALAEKFKNEAYSGYTQYKTKQLNNSGIKVSNIDNYINVDPNIRNKLDNSVDQMSTIIRNIDSMKDIMKGSGTELTTWTDSGRRIDSLFSDTVTKMKEVYNLGVLNGPDLWIVSSSLANPVWTSAFFTTNKHAEEYLDNVKNRLVSDINTKAKRYGIEFSPGGAQNQAGGTTNTPTKLTIDDVERAFNQ